jgi:hypothetical protein
LVTGQTDAGEAVVNVAHEALLREWPRLTDWVERNRAFLQTRARVQERAARWDEEGRPEDLLLPTGQPLAEARGLLKEREDSLSDTLRIYVERSIERAERREQRRRYVVGGVVAAFFLVVAGFGLFSYQQWSESAERRDQALRSQSLNLAEDARAQVENGDAMTGMLLALEALPEEMSNPERPYVPKAQSALYHALIHNREQWFVEVSHSITDADLGPKGRYLVAASKDSTARIYDLDRRKVVSVLQRHGAPVTAVEFDSSASRVLTAGGSSVQVWRMPDGNPVKEFTYRGGVQKARLSAEGTSVLTAHSTAGEKKSDSTTITLDTIPGGDRRAVRISGKRDLRHLAFGPSGQFIYATAVRGSDPESSTIHLWDGALRGHTECTLRGPEIMFASLLPEKNRMVVTTTVSYAAPTVVRFLTVW